MKYSTPLAAIVFGLTAVLAAPPAGAIDEGTLYLRRETDPIAVAGGALSRFTLREDPPFRDEERTIDDTVLTDGRLVEFARFYGLPAEGPDEVAVDYALARIFLTTGPSRPMQCCAEMTTTIYRQRFGALDVLAERTIFTTLAPKRPIGSESPVLVPLTFTDDPSLRSLEDGEGISVSIAVRNRCQDELSRNLNLRYDGEALATRLELTNDPITLPEPSDAVGAICEPCTIDTPNPEFCSCVGSICGDRDPCTTDGCVDGEGCSFSSLPGIDGLVCRTDAIVTLISEADSGSLAAKLRRKRSGLRRTATKNARAALKIRRLIETGRPSRKVGRKLRRLTKTLGKFEAKVGKAAGKNRMSSDFRDQMFLINDGAQANVVELTTG